ncbi:MAG: hypothetical protein GY764_11470 [Halieaceae bacterium]|nr:hypothetical protein [Halieaceae bacterium]
MITQQEHRSASLQISKVRPLMEAVGSISVRYGLYFATDPKDKNAAFFIITYYDQPGEHGVGGAEIRYRFE